MSTTNTKTVFYINFQFGANIFLGVENGIFTGCEGNSKMELAINKKYEGKTISFLKEDFEKSFRPSYSRVSPLDLNINLQQFTEWQGEIRRMIGRNQELTPDELNNLKLKEQRLSELESEINVIKHELKENHGYDQTPPVSLPGN